MVNKPSIFHSSANPEELQQNCRVKLFFTRSCGSLSEVSLGELFKEINKMERSKLPRPDSFFPRVPQEIKYEHGVTCNLDKIEKWEMANRRLLFFRV